MSLEEVLNREHHFRSSRRMTCLSYLMSDAFTARQRGWISRREATLTQAARPEQITPAPPLSTWLIFLCRWRRKTFHKLRRRVPLELAARLHNPRSSAPPPRFCSATEIVTSQSKRGGRTHFSVWVRKVTTNPRCKSADSDLIKRAWPLECETLNGPRSIKFTHTIQIRCQCSDCTVGAKRVACSPDQTNAGSRRIHIEFEVRMKSGGVKRLHNSPTARLHFLSNSNTNIHHVVDLTWRLTIHLVTRWWVLKSKHTQLSAEFCWFLLLKMQIRDTKHLFS